MDYNQVPKLTTASSALHIITGLQARGSLTMNSFDLSVRREGILAKLAADTTLLISAEGDAEMAVLGAIDLSLH